RFAQKVALAVPRTVLTPSPTMLTWSGPAKQQSVVVNWTWAPSTRFPCVSDTLAWTRAQPPCSSPLPAVCPRTTFGLATRSSRKPEAALGCVLVPRLGPLQLTRAAPTIRTHSASPHGILRIGFLSVARVWARVIAESPARPRGPCPSGPRDRLPS